MKDLKNALSFSLLVLLLPLQLYAGLGSKFYGGTLAEEKTLKIDLLATDLKASDINITIEVECQTGWHPGNSHYCGGEGYTASVNDDGTVVIPELKKFENYYGMNSRNYKTYLNVKVNENTAVIKFKSIKLYDKFDKVLRLNKIKAATIPLTINSESLFGSEFSKADNWDLTIRFERDGETLDKDYGVTTSFLPMRKLYENNFYRNKEDFKNLKELALQDIYYLESFTGNSNPKTHLSFSVHKNGWTQFGSSFKLDLDTDALLKLTSDQLELKPVKQ